MYLWLSITTWLEPSTVSESHAHDIDYAIAKNSQIIRQLIAGYSLLFLYIEKLSFQKT